MGKKITYKLDYREKGNKKQIHIPIDFISRGIVRDYENLREKQDDLRDKVNRIQNIELLLAENKKNKPKDYRKISKELKKESNEISFDILQFNKDEFIDEQLKLIKLILVDNGVTNQMLLEDYFWNNQVDVVDILDFLSDCIYKDVDLKKKQ